MKKQKKGLGVPRSKAAGRSSAAAGEDAERSPAPSREIPDISCRPMSRASWLRVREALDASPIPFRGKPFIRVEKYNLGIVVKITSGVWWEGITNEGELMPPRKFIAALGIGAARPKGGVRSKAKDGTRAKPGASRATPKS